MAQEDLDNVDAALDAMIEAPFADNQDEIKSHPVGPNSPAAGGAIDIDAEIARAAAALRQNLPGCPASELNSRGGGGGGGGGGSGVWQLRHPFGVLGDPFSRRSHLHATRAVGHAVLSV